MNSDIQPILSYYKEVAEINPGHGITLVQHRETGKFHVKKLLSVYQISLLRQLQKHPVRNTPHIYHLSENDEILTLIEDYIPGSTLQELLEKEGSLPEKQVIDYAIQLCSILEELHGRQPAVIHRDIKPSNVILTPDGVVYLLDFNAAKFVDTTAERDTLLLGTQGFAAPEQYGFCASSARTDLYALGALMNTLLGGNSSPVLRPVIQKCLEMNPRDRYASAAELKYALHTALNGSPPSSGSRPYSWLPPGFRSGRPGPMLLAASGYLIGIFFFLTIRLKGISGPQLTLNRLMLTAFFLSVILFSGNYRSVHHYIPLCRSKHKILRLIGILLFDLIIFAFYIMLILFLEQLFFE